MKLDLETEIRYPSGERAGFIKKVVLDKDRGVDEVVMATDNLMSRSLIVPVTLLSEESGGVVTLNLSPEEVDNLPEYTEETVPAVTKPWDFNENAVPGGDVFPDLYTPIMPVAEIANVAPGSIRITQGTEIWCLDAPWGIVDQVIVGEDEQAEAFIGRSNNIEEHNRLIPLDLVSEADETRVVLNCTIEDISTYTEEVIDYTKEPEQT